MDTISVLSPDRGETLHKSYGIHNILLFQCFVKIIRKPLKGFFNFLMSVGLVGEVKQRELAKRGIPLHE